MTQHRDLDILLIWGRTDANESRQLSNEQERDRTAHTGDRGTSTASLVIPEGALVVKAALLEEEHDFWGSSACLDLIAAALHRQGRVKAGGAAEGKP
jgi:hypothetical protein